MAKRWTVEDIEYLKKKYQYNDMPAMIKHLGRTEDAIQWKASQMGYIFRDGRKTKALYKVIVNVSEEHYEFLTAHSNRSALVRQGLDLLIKKLKK